MDDLEIRRAAVIHHLQNGKKMLKFSVKFILLKVVKTRQSEFCFCTVLSKDSLRLALLKTAKEKVPIN